MPSAWYRGGLFAGMVALIVQSAPALEIQTLQQDGIGFRVVDVDLARDTLEAHWRDPDGAPFGSIDALRRWGDRQSRPLRFAANAGIYDRHFEPLGLYVEDGRVIKPLNTARGNARGGNFSLQPNGVFYVDRTGNAGVTTTAAWLAHPVDARLATQSGPMLVIDGEINGAFDAASDSLKWRSGICAQAPRGVRVAVSLAPVSFHAFARLFRDELGCRDALYLDGTLSQVYTEKEGYAGAPAMMLKPYAGMLAVFGDH